MIINETLARGLKDRFFQDFATEISGARHKEMSSMTLRSHKRGKWVKATRACMDRLDRFSIASYEGGSKVKPYFVTNVLEVESERQYNTWNERCLLIVPALELSARTFAAAVSIRLREAEFDRLCRDIRDFSASYLAPKAAA